MVGRPRKHNRHLPARVYLSHGQYFFVDCQNVWHPLGRNLGDMYRNYAEYVDEKKIRTMHDLFEKYRLQEVPKKSEKWQVEQARYLKRLDAVFGKMKPETVRPRHVYAYRHKREQSGHLTTANRELETLKHVFTMAIEWGVLDSSPARDVRKLPRQKRNRYVTDAEFQAVYDVASPMMQAAMDFAVLTALRRGDLLSLTRKNLVDDGILVQTSKTDKGLLIEWSGELREVVDRCKRLRPHIRQHLIANGRGKQYTGTGFGSIWQRAVDRAMKAGTLKERFSFHDLRAKSASEARA
jgi:integrase